MRMMTGIRTLFLTFLCAGVSVAFFLDTGDRWSAGLSPEVDDQGLYVDELPTVNKRYSISSACRQCVSSPSDWSSCSICYAGPGPVPFFGYEKRAKEISAVPSPNGDSRPFAALDKLAASVEKRSSFLTCRCCISLNNRDCCDKCSLTPYYGKRSEPPSSPVESVKRDERHFPWPLKGMCSVCCSKETYDFVCCYNVCSKKK